MGLFWMHRTPGKEGMMTPEALRSTLDYHRNLPVFAARPLTSGAVAVLGRWTGADETRVLALLNPLLLVVSACLIYALALFWGAAARGAWIATALYLFSFTNLFAFVPPIYTYDEPLQFVTMLAACWFLPRPCVLRQNAGALPAVPSYNIPYALLAGLCMGLSWWARESGLLFLPVLAGLYLPYASKQERIRLGITVLTALGVLALGRMASNPATSTGDLWQWQARFSNLKANFRNIDYTVETLAGLGLVLAWPLVLLRTLVGPYRILTLGLVVSLIINTLAGIFMVLAWPLVLLPPLLGKFRFLTFGLVASLVVNTLIVLFMAKAREARLFALPLLLVWPLLGLRRYEWPTTTKPIRPINWLLLVLGLAGTLHLAWNLYQSTVGPNTANFFREYLTVYGISLAFYWSFNRSKDS
jgi:hypothetical protein